MYLSAGAEPTGMRLTEPKANLDWVERPFPLS